MRPPRPRFLVLALALVVSGPAAGDPGRGLVQRCLQRYARARTFRCSVSATYAMNLGKKARDARARTRLALARPNRLAVVPDASHALPATVCDGQVLWQTSPLRKQYIRVAAPPSLDELALDVRDVGRVSPLAATVCLRYLTPGSAHRLLSETDRVRTLGGEPVHGRPCRRVRMTYAAKGAILDVWIDESAWLVRRSMLDFSASVAANYEEPLATTRSVLVEEYRDVAMDVPLPDTSFAFAAAEGWRRVPELGASSGSPPTRAARTPVGRRAPVIAVRNLSGRPGDVPPGDGRPAPILFWRDDAVNALALDVTNALYRRFAPRGVGFVGVHVGKARGCADAGATAAHVARLARRRKVAFQIALDPRGLGAAAYELRGLPAVAAVDRDGHLHSLDDGSAIGLRRTLCRRIQALLAP